MAASSSQSPEDFWGLTSVDTGEDEESDDYGRGDKHGAPPEELQRVHKSHFMPRQQYDSNASTGEDEDSDYGRGDKHGAPCEEFQRRHRTKMGGKLRFASNVSSCSITSSMLLQEIPEELMRPGCRRVKKRQDLQGLSAVDRERQDPVGSLAASFYTGEDQESGNDRGDKHPTPSEELQRGYRAYGSKTSSGSTTYSPELEEMIAEGMRAGCMQTKEGEDLVGTLASAIDEGESSESDDGRGDKHRAPSQELRRDYRAYDSSASFCSTGSSLLMQEIGSDEKRLGCRKVKKGWDPMGSEDSLDTVPGKPGTPTEKNTARARYSSAWRGLNVSVQPTAQVAKYKKVMYVGHQWNPRSRNAEQGGPPPVAEGTLVGTNADLIRPTGPSPVPKAPSMPQTGRPQPGSRFQAGNRFPMMDNAVAHMGSGKAYHQELIKVRETLEGLQVDPRELHWEDRIGAGSTAEVFKGTWDRIPGKELAIKRLNMSTRRCEQLTQEVAHLREIALLASIQHDNLVKFYGFSFEGQHILVTEFCKGGPVSHLLHVIDPLQLVIEQQLKMCGDVARAMDFLHKSKPQIIHRDLKSLNLLLLEAVTSTTSVPHVKVSDFGLSKMQDDESGWDEMTVGVGTVHWMAPEVATGSYNEKADIYSFAMVLFEIICNEIPFEELEFSAVLLATSRGSRPDLQAIPVRTPKDLVDLMQQCWAEKPSERPSFEYISTTLATIGRNADVIMSWGDAMSHSTLSHLSQETLSDGLQGASPG